MDQIDVAIAKGWDVTESALKENSWEEFFEIAAGRKVYIYGVAEATAFLLHKADLRIDGIVDEDERKWGLWLHEFTDVEQPNVGDFKILAPFELPADHESFVVLIAGTRYYEKAATDLEKMGVKYFFAAVICESKVRVHVDTDINEIEHSITDEYVKHALEMPIEKHKIIFYTMGTYGGHGKYIAKQLQKLRDDIDYVWLVHDMKVEVPRGVRKVYMGYTRRVIEEMETAGMWVYDRMVPNYIQKRPGQIYVQTKHWASITLKTFGADMKTFRKEQAGVSVVEHNGEMMDYLITGSEFDTRTVTKGYLFKGKCLELGSARSDALFHPQENKQKVCDYYGLNPEAHYLLYAPTFRCRSGSYYIPESKSDLDFAVVKKALESKYGGEWKIILRLHPTVCVQSRNIEKPPYVVDASFYPDSQELVAASDIMITDYSSLMFEPAFVQKPVFLFATDKEDYISVERELLIDYDTLPFPIAESNEELYDKITGFDYEEYKKTVEAFLAGYGVHEDGHAGERAAAFINTLI